MENINVVEIVLMVLSIVIGFNVMLSGLSKILETIKDKTDTTIDNTIYKWVNRISGWLQWVVDLVQANLQHKKK